MNAKMSADHDVKSTIVYHTDHWLMGEEMRTRFCQRLYCPLYIAASAIACVVIISQIMS